MALRLVAVLFSLALIVVAGPAWAADEAVRLIPQDGTEFEINGRRYAGELTITASPSGLALTETTSVDQYLAGIKEVPFGWPDEALAAQVVAARTYLANTLRNGRSERGREFGYDICASSACQVYAGTSYLDEQHGDRWLTAVQRTAGEIITYNGGPILAVYMSSAGSRTMAVQDVWGGAALPYLQPVDSPEAGVSPFATWHVEVPSYAFIDVLAADGHSISGDLLALDHRVPPEGEGRASLLLTTTDGTATVLGTEVKGAMNRQGADLYPELLPGLRTDGKRLPQALPSYKYQVSFIAAHDIPERLVEFLPPEDVAKIGTVRFDGEGWGHNLGMSQYGALAMAQRGATYEDILAHYYGGLIPENGADHLPDQVAVGLGWELDAIAVTASGPFTVVAGDGAPGPRSAGAWWAFADDGRVLLAPSIDAPPERKPKDGVPQPV